ncbi:MAG: LysM peptidoglycan-binding domain-containing protein [Bacteroidota bacterium]
MIKIKATYVIFLLTIAYCLLPNYSFSQGKSADIRTLNGKKYYIHKVEKGQSLYAIAKVYNMDVNSILAENDDAIDGLKTGQELKVPFESLLQKPSTAIDTNKYVYHRIKKGETIYAITKKYAIDEKKLMAYNPTLASGLKEGEFVIVGEKKKTSALPIKPQALKDTLYYTVAASETVYGLTRKFNITQEEFFKWNPLAKEGVKAGQIVKLPKVTSLQNTDVVAVVKPTDTIAFNKPKKTAYTIGLFLPFKLAESEQIDIDALARSKSSFPATQALALDFYAGFKKAVDSLQAKDFDVTLNIYDLQERDSAKAEAICKSAEFKTLDVIFGPLYPGAFKTVSAYAKPLGIPTISPLTQQSKILYNNPLSSKVTPSQYTIIEGLADFCIDSLTVGNHMILVNTTLKDQAYVKTFKERYNNELLRIGKTLKDSITEVKGLAGIKSAFIPGRKNVVVMLTNNPVYLQDVITQLYVFSNKKDIILLGFSNVANIDNLDQDYLNDLQFHFASATGISCKDSLQQKLVKYYQNIYVTDPSEYFFEGYDVANYYLSNLKTKGPGFFANLDKYPAQGLSTGFEFYRPDEETGYENRAIFIYKYSDYKLQKLGWR